MTGLLQLIPQYHARVWGGARLQPAAAEPIGEAWLVYEGNRIAAGRHAGRTLAQAAAEEGAALLGARAAARTGARFPLLIKLLDCQDWLSIQVHPNDDQAVRLEGAGQFGKTEAWHVLEAEPGARLIAGVNPGVSASALAAAIRAGGVEACARYHAVRAGDTMLMPAGTLHALGPGLLIYEVQQTSDLTYRVYDWGRPASAGRALHLEKSAAVADPGLGGQLAPAPPPGAGSAELTGCPYFALRRLTAEAAPLAMDTRGESFHALTVIAGRGRVRCGAEVVELGRHESVVVPAGAGAYTLEPDGAVQALCSLVPSA